jgi:small subunit ribosomal protein S2
MALPEFSLRQLLEAGVHFGHQTHRWNPRMDRYIYGQRGGIHIIDLTQTVPLIDAALNAVRETVAKGGRILFVGTKRQAAKPVAEAAERSAQYFMNHRWLGGTLTNWQTVSKSIARLKEIDEKLESGATGLTKKERLGLEREQTKLQASLGGIREMGTTPDLLVVIDTNKEALAVAEANKLGIPVIAILDTNSAPEGIEFPIPGNDDAARAISLYCDLIARAALDGMAAQMGSAGIDIGALEEAAIEETLAEEAPAPAAEEAPAPAAKAPTATEEVAAEPSGTAPELFAEAPEKVDDLKQITGVGPALEEKLNKLGVYTLAQIASWTPDQIAWIDDSLSFKGRVERDDWVGQAELLVVGK